MKNVIEEEWLRVEGLWNLKEKNVYSNGNHYQNV